MKKYLLSALLLAFPLLVSAYDVEIDGICYNLNPNEQVAEVSHLHYNLGEIFWSFDYRFAPESNSSGEECYAFPQAVWERLKTDTFYVTIKGDYPMINLNDGWWSCTYTGNSIQPGNKLLADNGDGTWTLTVNFAGEPILDVMDSRHILFTGTGYYVMDIYFKEAVAGDGSEDEQEKTIVWENGTYLSNAANIPEKIIYEDVEYTVSSIGARGLCGYKNLVSVTIPNSVTAIASSAIEGCRNLTSVVVESGNKIYDSRDNCNAIIETSTNTLVAGCKSTVIPNSVTSIGDFAFFKCGGLTSVDIPNSVTTIGEGAFGSCSGLSSVDIPNSVTSIGIYAFGGCANLISVTIPNSVTNIGNWAFSSCIQLSSVTIPNSVTSIGDYTFAYCYDLNSVRMSNNVTYIGDYAFLSCTGLTSITIPNSVTSIGDAAFSFCI